MATKYELLQQMQVLGMEAMLSDGLKGVCTYLANSIPAVYSAT
jgi:hypothetical protein